MRNKISVQRQLERVDNELNQLSSILRQGGENTVYLYNEKLKQIKDTLSDVNTLLNGESDEFN